MLSVFRLALNRERKKIYLEVGFQSSNKRLKKFLVKTFNE